MIKKILAVSVIFGLACSATAYAMETPVFEAAQASEMEYEATMQSDYMFGMAQTGAQVNISELQKPIVVDPTVLEETTKAQITVETAAKQEIARANNSGTKAATQATPATTAKNTVLTAATQARSTVASGTTENQEQGAKGYLNRDKTKPANNVIEMDE